ncbi:EF-hand domain-containing protein [Novosphingobium sp. RD2P27]|uniref:EF-hand domain-containing protein n=1 Tax=Novosphingobium kalidii TaxID=3230299 RepID=A0ABV2D0I3_9SPHN
MHKPLSAVALIAALAVGAPTAAAQAGAKPMHMGVHDRASWFEAADRDDNEQLSRAEFRDFRTNTMPRDQLAMYRADRRSSMFSPVDRSFAQLDQDGNGTVSLTEFANAPAVTKPAKINNSANATSASARTTSDWSNPDYVTATYYMTIQPVDAKVVEGKPVVNLKGERVGRIDRIVRTRDENRYYAMIDLQGTPYYMLGNTRRDEAGVPLDDVLLFRDGSSVMLSSRGEEFLRETDARVIENPERVERLYQI